MTYRVFEVPRAGIEPARIASLVFETNASTNSAIWAWTRAKRKDYEVSAFSFCGCKVKDNW